MRHLEAQSQRAVMRWWGYSCKVLLVPEHLLFAVANGGYRRPREAMLLKQEGVRSGVSDLILLVPRGHWHGMALEMKAADGRLSKEQTQFLNDAKAQGYHAIVARSTDEAIEAITNYLRTELP
jgi:hypothetical protein